MATREEQVEMILERFGCDPDTLYKSIGRFVFNFSRFEDVVRGRVIDMMGLDQRNRQVLTAAADFAFLCTTCKTLYAELFPGSPKLKQLKGIINEGMNINTTARLPLAHGSWYINKPAGWSVHTSRSSLEERDFFGEPGELDKLADRLFSLRHQLWTLIAEDTEPLAHRVTQEAIRPFARY